MCHIHGTNPEFERRLAKVELTVADHQDRYRWEEFTDTVSGIVDAAIEQFQGDFEGVMQQLRDDMQGTLNEVVERCTKASEEGAARIAQLQGDVNRLRGELEASRAERRGRNFEGFVIYKYKKVLCLIHQYKVVT